MSLDEITADERVVEEVDFEGDPETIIRSRTTPKALERLYETLETAQAGSNALDRAITRALEIDKRLAPKAPPPSNTLNVMTFDPTYLKGISEAIGGMFRGRVEETRPAIEAPNVDRKRVGRRK